MSANFSRTWKEIDKITKEMQQFSYASENSHTISHNKRWKRMSLQCSSINAIAHTQTHTFRPERNNNRRELRGNHCTRSKTSRTNKFYYIWSYDSEFGFVAFSFQFETFLQMGCMVWCIRLCTLLHCAHTTHTCNVHCLQVRIKYPFRI